ncbi:protein MCM10 homolog isoform X1 [Selaginella moellendorffii]|uniref:protein MCM10 homolog isoform X1 n=1 Tax=Selaginella moellendorffii TaxID=88036 RepID=UPI000D1C9B75|nr:protein MCM10 homolog isoform X1 [Selaginella moellendorffii]|eukprot:XP_024532694.1 protein MCM10 homolog isoform X1 [Selaginella moellendorffii]
MADLELLLSLRDECGEEKDSTEIKDRSNSSEILPRPSTGYCSDEEERPKSVLNMSIFKDVLKSSGSLAKCPPASVEKSKGVSVQSFGSNGSTPDLEVHSGLRIRNRCLSREMLTTKLMELRFVKLEALKHAVIGDGVRGSWATIAVLSDKGQPRVSSNSKNYVIWKLSCLNESTVSLFLFGDAYKEHWKEAVGSVIAVFDAKVRHDDKKGDFSLSVADVNQLTVVGTSLDFAICNGKRKDGAPCSVPVNRKEGAYCKFHALAARKNLRSKRPELNGGNLATGLTGSMRNQNRGMQSLKHTIEKSPEQPLKRVKHRSSLELSKMLSNGDKMTTRTSSQGLRFLARMTEDKELSSSNQKKKAAVSDRKPSDKKQVEVSNRRPCRKVSCLKQERDSVSRPPLKELSNSSKDRALENEVVEIDLEVEEDTDNAMAQAMSIFKS